LFAVSTPPMSFTFDWPNFSDQFHYDAIQMLNTALNKGTKPPVMADKIEVVELQMGTQVWSFIEHSGLR
jgi:distribution and morphology protein 34